MPNYNENKIYWLHNASYSSKNITQHWKISPVEAIEIIGTGDAITRNVSQNGRNIEIAKTQRLSDRETGRNWWSCSASR